MDVVIDNYLKTYKGSYGSVRLKERMASSIVDISLEVGMSTTVLVYILQKHYKESERLIELVYRLSAKNYDKVDSVIKSIVHTLIRDYR